MKVIHIESGLGNQMLSYCEYLAIKKMNPCDDCYIETLIYDIPECNDVICQWNGYELDRIFGINPPNIEQAFSPTQWQQVKQDVENSKFWLHNWNYPIAITQALNKAGLDIKNFRGNFEDGKTSPKTNIEAQKGLSLITRFGRTRLGDIVRRQYYKIREPHFVAQAACPDKLFVKSNQSLFTGQRLSFKFRNNNLEEIEDQVRHAFTFAPFSDQRNVAMMQFLQSCNAVAIHARMGDMYSSESVVYKYGYFKRAVNYIKRHVEAPVFVFFTNTGSIEWCKTHGNVFGLDFSRDQVHFVDWNKDTESYRDMQLMAYCKHAIITESSFGWWGSFFITNPNKITISPLLTINTTHHC